MERLIQQWHESVLGIEPRGGGVNRLNFDRVHAERLGQVQ